MGISFKEIKTIMNENYSGSKLELAALGGDYDGVAKELASRGISSNLAAEFCTLIRSGMSEAQALNLLDHDKKMTKEPTKTPEKQTGVLPAHKANSYQGWWSNSETPKNINSLIAFKLN